MGIRQAWNSHREHAGDKRFLREVRRQEYPSTLPSHVQRVEEAAGRVAAKSHGITRRDAEAMGASAKSIRQAQATANARNAAREDARQMRERQAQRDSGKRPVDKVGTIEREGNTYRLTGEWHFEGKPGEEPTVHPGGKDVTALTGWTGPELANMAFHAENEKTLDRWRHPSRDTPKDPEAQREIGE